MMPRACCSARQSSGVESIARGLLTKVASLLLLLIGGSVTAAERAPQLAAADSLMSPENLVQMVIALLVVVALIVILAVVVRRFSLLPGSSTGLIRVLSGLPLPLNSKDRLLLIQVGEEQILISASPGRIAKVHEMESPLDPEQLRAARKPESRTFAGIFESLTQRTNP